MTDEGDYKVALPRSRRHRTSDKSRVEVVSDGTGSGTNVFLVLEDDDGHLFRYRIPNILSISFTIDKVTGAQLFIGLGSVSLKTTVGIGPGKSTVEDLLTEIAATRLAADRGDPK